MGTSDLRTRVVAQTPAAFDIWGSLRSANLRTSSRIRLTFDDDYDQAIHDVNGPRSLERLAFGHRFYQPIHEVVWPATLQRLEFAHNLNRPIDRVKWPAFLTRLAFGFCIRKPIRDVVWPARLTHLAFESVDISFREGVWPGWLLQPTVGGVDVVIG